MKTLLYLKPNETKRVQIRESKRFIQDLSFTGIAPADRARIKWTEIANPRFSWVTIEGPGFIHLIQEGDNGNC